MTEPLGERLEELEKAVRRAAEVIAMLRKERDTLAVQGGRGRRRPHRARRLRQERKEMLGQVNAMLKEMEKLDL